MWENAYFSIKNPKASRTCLNPAADSSLCHISIFQPQNLYPPLDKIFNPHLYCAAYSSQFESEFPTQVQVSWRQQMGLSAIFSAKKVSFSQFLILSLRNITINPCLDLPFHGSRPIFHLLKQCKQNTNESTFLEGNFSHFL